MKDQKQKPPTIKKAQMLLDKRKQIIIPVKESREDFRFCGTVLLSMLHLFLFSSVHLPVCTSPHLSILPQCITLFYAAVCFQGLSNFTHVLAEVCIDLGTQINLFYESQLVSE